MWSDSLLLWAPVLPPGLNGSDGLIRMHHRAISAKRDEWTLLIRAALSRRVAVDSDIDARALITRRLPLPRCRIIYERRVCWSTPPDWDNVLASFKLPGDALKHAGVIAEDNVEVVTQLLPRAVRVPKRSGQGVLLHLFDGDLPARCGG